MGDFDKLSLAEVWSTSWSSTIRSRARVEGRCPSRVCHQRATTDSKLIRLALGAMTVRHEIPSERSQALREPHAGSRTCQPRAAAQGECLRCAAAAFTPVADTMRGLLTNAAIGDHAGAAIAWSVGIAVLAYVWAIHLYNTRRAAEPN